jgi:glycosyltransferase involved in cell wall biosynthesis
MKISYAILTHNEGAYIEKLLSFLSSKKRGEDEIVVVDDYSTDELTKAILEEHESMGNIRLIKNELESNFAKQKNFLTTHCKGDYIFQIDADEMLSEELINDLPTILESNPDNEVYLVPRINTVDGLTQEHVIKWGWNVNENGFINFPDYQWRIYKNDPRIVWINKVHERLSGFKTYAALPEYMEYCLLHHKTIDRQENQNNFYDKL